ncbi:MAG: sigma-70 family RNA polymerase sigma factor, partial [Nitrososphaeraceae archaeon]|nr:sigma-70 family RNA polymerase sigma factor [Nitrososphaeraceae archaeon]
NRNDRDEMTADFEELVRQNIGRIRRIAMRYADHGETEDLIQEILLALWRSYSSFQGDSRIETWIYRVALNTALSGLRKIPLMKINPIRFL